MFPLFFKYPLPVFTRGHFVFLSGWPAWLLCLLIVLAVAGLAGVIQRRRTRGEAPGLTTRRVWALWALGPRRRGAADGDRYDEEPGYWDDDTGDDDRWDDDGWDAPLGPRPGERTDTVERPALRRPSEFDEWGRRRPG